MDIGVVQHVFRGCGDDDARFAKAAAMRVPCIEADLTAADLAGAGATAEPPRLRSLLSARDRHGVAVSSLCLGFHNSEGMVFAHWRGSRPDEEVATAVRWCKVLGAGAVLVPFFFANEPKNAVQRKLLAGRLKPLAALAGELGVHLCVEGTLTVEQAWQMAERVGGEAFGVYFDPGNSLWLERDPAAEVRALGRLLRRCHLKDTKVNAGDALLGTGLLDGPAFAKALRDVGYGGPVIIEAFGRSDEDVARELSVARGWFAGG